MRRLVLSIELVILALVMFVVTPVNHGEVKNPDEKLLQRIQMNRVVLECITNHGEEWYGQGTITNVNSDGVWITTAAHVTEDSEHCVAQFKNGTFHTAFLKYAYKNSDVSVLVAPNTTWGSYAPIKTLTVGSHLFVFGQVLEVFYVDPQGNYLGSGMSFNDKLYDGMALLHVSHKSIFYTDRKYNLVITDLYAAPGSSGGGVFDEDGNLVGVVSGGARYDRYVSFIVDLVNATRQEEKEHVQITN